MEAQVVPDRCPACLSAWSSMTTLADGSETARYTCGVVLVQNSEGRRYVRGCPHVGMSVRDRLYVAGAFLGGLTLAVSAIAATACN